MAKIKAPWRVSNGSTCILEIILHTKCLIWKPIPVIDEEFFEKKISTCGQVCAVGFQHVAKRLLPEDGSPSLITPPLGGGAEVVGGGGGAANR